MRKVNSIRQFESRSFKKSSFISQIASKSYDAPKKLIKILKKYTLIGFSFLFIFILFSVGFSLNLDCWIAPSWLLAHKNKKKLGLVLLLNWSDQDNHCYLKGHSILKNRFRWIFLVFLCSTTASWAAAWMDAYARSSKSWMSSTVNARRAVVEVNCLISLLVFLLWYFVKHLHWKT